MTAAKASFQFCRSHVFRMSCQSFITTALISCRTETIVISPIINSQVHKLSVKSLLVVTLVILLCVLVKYFFWVFCRSSAPPAMARMMLSAMRLSWRQRSTAPSKSPVSRACVISPSTSGRRTNRWEYFQRIKHNNRRLFLAG